MNESNSKDNKKKGSSKTKGSTKKKISLKDTNNENSSPNKKSPKSKSDTIGERWDSCSSDSDDDNRSLKKSNSLFKRLGFSGGKKSDDMLLSSHSFSSSTSAISITSKTDSIQSHTSNNNSKSSIKQFVKSLGKSSNSKNKSSSADGSNSPRRSTFLDISLKKSTSSLTNKSDDIISLKQNPSENHESTPPRSHAENGENDFWNENGNCHFNSVMTPPSNVNIKMESPLLLATSCKKLGEDIRKKNESSKKKKKKRKSLKITECRKQLLDDDDDEEATDDSLFESSEEGSVQKKLREMEINASEPPSLNRADSDDFFSKLNNNMISIDTKNNNADDKNSSIISNLSSPGSHFSQLKSIQSTLSCTSSFFIDTSVDDVYELKEPYCVDNNSLSSPEYSSGNSNHHNDSDSYSSDDYDDYDDESCDSTVVNGLSPLRPPPTATKDEQNKFYWEFCYGKVDGNDKMQKQLPNNEFSSINRLPPTKSCLSTKKKCWSAVSAKRNHNITMKPTPTLLDRFGFHNKQKPAVAEVDDYEMMDEFDPSPVPKTKDTINNDNLVTPIQPTNRNNGNCLSVRSVTFGSPSAAEFDFERPTVEFTPLPTALARERFPVDPAQNESDEESEEEHRETARNAATLAAWDEDFDSLIDDDMDDDDFNSPSVLQHSTRGRKNRNDRKSFGRNDRRSSSLFSRKGGSLLGDDSNTNDSRSVSTSNIKQESNLSCASISLFSPSASDTSGFSKETPNSERTLSSALLRTVHCSGGASLGNTHVLYDDIFIQKIKPNQLDSVLQSAEFEESMCNKSRKINIERLLLDPATKVEWNFKAFIDELMFYESEMLSRQEVLSAIHHAERDPALGFKLFLECVSNIDKEIGHHHLFTQDNAREDIIEVLKMAISTLEQQNVFKDVSNNTGFDVNSFCEKNGVAASDLFTSETYNDICNQALQEWQKIEIETVQTAIAWLQPLEEGNREEELRIDSSLKKVPESFLVCPNHDEKIHRSNKTTQIQIGKKIEDEANAIDILEKQIEVESRHLSFAQAQEELWNSRFALEVSAPISVIRSLLLCTIVPFEACTVQHDMLDLAFPHLDGSRTILSWRSSMGDSFDSSMISLDSVDDILKSKPTFRRLIDSPFVEDRRPQDGIPYPRPLSLNVTLDPFLTDVYNTFVQDIQIKALIANVWTYNKSLGIPISTDIFGRIDLVMKDLTELRKHNKCTFEKFETTNVCKLVVEIDYGLDRAIGIGFTYDFSYPRCGLYFIPRLISVFSIKGEPETPLHLLQEAADKLLMCNEPCNAFFLKRVCTGVMDNLVNFKF